LYKKRVLLNSREASDPHEAPDADPYRACGDSYRENHRHDSLTANITWQDQRVNLDLSVYRLDDEGHAINPAVTRSVGERRAFENAVYAPSGAPVEPGRYLVVVDNVCSRDADDDPRTPVRDRANCGIGGEVPNEDDFDGTVTLGNQTPTVALEGPDRVPARQAVTYTARASDAEGEISTYLFDLDGDGTYELDSDGNPEVAHKFPTRGTYTIQVQVLDDAGAVGYATKTVTVTRPPKAASRLQPVTTFRLSRKSFGGAAKRRLVVTYRLREKARVEVKLRRGKRLVRLIGRGGRKAGRYYRIVLSPSHLKKGVYTVRMSVLAASGKRQVVQLSARRR